MTKASNLRDMAIPELELAINDLNKELFALVNDKKRSKKLEKPHLIREKKKQKARMLTIISEKQISRSQSI
ncbi:MAG: 50S ribosomal protein L29 [Parachlamydiaceae bacterium]